MMFHKMGVKKRIISSNYCIINLVLMMMMMIIAHGVAIVEGSRSISSNIGLLSLGAAGICASEVIIHGYPCQEFHVTTDDGYILSVQRIPDSRPGAYAGNRGGAAGGSNKQPVLLQHGLLVDGATWMMNSPEESLAYILADNGFDVWIANTRGTRFSHRHISLKPTSREYWNWSWDDLVIHDLPAVIDFVSNQTAQKLHYVGHSLGTLVALASFSERRQVDKVKSAALLSPIAYLGHMTSALGVVAAKAFVGEITTLFGLAEFDPTGVAVATLLKVFCSQPGVDCYDLLAALTGKNCCLNASTVEHFLKNEPQPTSTKNMVHLAQTVRKGMLTKYDYGNANYNLVHYGENMPPAYDLANIPPTLPLFLTYGGQDALSDPRDVENLLDSLKYHDVDKLHVQYIRNYAHADFIMGVNAKDVVYNQIVEFFSTQR